MGTSPAWTVEGDQDGARFGDSVGTAGDTNGGGHSTEAGNIGTVVGFMLVGLWRFKYE